MRSMLGLAAVILAAAGAAGQDKPPPIMGPVLTLTLDAWGEVTAPGREQPLRSPRELKDFLTKLFEDNRKKKVEEPTILILAHRQQEYHDIFEVLQGCSNSGFRKLRVRARADSDPVKRPSGPALPLGAWEPVFTAVLSSPDPTKTGTIGRFRINAAAKTEDIDATAWEKPLRDRLTRYRPPGEDKTPVLVLEADEAVGWKVLGKVRDVAHTEGYAISFRRTGQKGEQVPKR